MDVIFCQRTAWEIAFLTKRYDCPDGFQVQLPVSRISLWTGRLVNDGCYLPCKWETLVLFLSILEENKLAQVQER